MSCTTSKPQFTFKGLSYLYHIDQCRLSPVGYDRDGTKYFELIDLVENKQIFTVEITALDEDLVLKDKYGIIRFCVHGWQDMGQLDTYVNIKKPVGIVKEGVMYDHHRKPVFKVQQTNKGAFGCFGPPTFKITSATTGGEIGYITPEPASMHARFDQFLDEGPKATIIAYAVQLALCKYRMLNLNLQKVKYVYKDRAKAKARKESEKIRKESEKIRKESEKMKGSLPVQPVDMPQAPPPPTVLVVTQPTTSTPAGPAADLIEAQRRSLETERRKSEEERMKSEAERRKSEEVRRKSEEIRRKSEEIRRDSSKKSQPQIVLIQVPPPPAPPNETNIQVVIPKVPARPKEEPPITIVDPVVQAPIPPPPEPSADGREAQLVLVKKKVYKKKGEKGQPPPEPTERTVPIQRSPPPTAAGPGNSSTAGPGKVSALTGINETPTDKSVKNPVEVPVQTPAEKSVEKLAKKPESTENKRNLFRVLQSHTTPSYLWDGEYQGRTGGRGQVSPFAPVEEPENTAVTGPRDADGQQPKGVTSQPPIKPRKRNMSTISKQASGSAEIIIPKTSHGSGSSAQSNKGGSKKASKASMKDGAGDTVEPTPAKAPSSTAESAPAPSSTAPAPSTTAQRPASTARPPSTTTAPTSGTKAKPLRGSDDSSGSDPTIIETDSEYYNRNTRAVPEAGPIKKNEGVEPNAKRRETEVRGQRQSVATDVGRGVRVIQSHASVTAGDTVGHNKRGSSCHASCDKRAEKNASVKRGSHQVNDSDSAMVQVVMNKPPTRPPGQPRDSRAVSKDLGVRQQSLFDDQRQSVFVSRQPGVSDSVTTRAQNIDTKDS